MPLLKEHQTFLYQKISLAALTETIFRRPPHDRAMTFTEISQETKVQPKEIEHLIMKALSLGLVKGQIDQVAEIARINWVQPKVLDMKQIESMRGRLKEWDASVNQLGNWIEGLARMSGPHERRLQWADIDLYLGDNGVGVSVQTETAACTSSRRVHSRHDRR